MFKSISADAQPTSVSGQLAAKVRAELNSVPLPDAYDGKFQDCFFPKKGQPRAQFTYFGQQVARTQARLRLYFNLLTQLMRNSPQIQQAAVLDQAIGANTAQEVVDNIVASTIAGLRAVAEDEYWKPNYVNAALNAAMRSTHNAICLPSDTGFRITNVPLDDDRVGYDWDVLS